MLFWARKEQPRLRAHTYQGLADLLREDDVNPADIGRRVVLPSSHPGSERHMQQLYQDAMAITRVYGKPDFFITFTANPSWPEIQRELKPGRKPVDRPDIVCRVFHIKTHAFFEELEGNCFGPFKACVWTVEYQKRGLPHVHYLLWTHHDGISFQDPRYIDDLILTELPSPEIDPTKELTATVRSCLMHNRCGPDKPRAVCMEVKGGRRTCSKGFPKPFNQQTSPQHSGYPLYRRREDIPCWGPDGERALSRDENRWVVPYNPYLTRRFAAHINVEICTSIQAIKYVFKYIYKGSDRATVEIDNPIDEIKTYAKGRYIGPQQVWFELFCYRTHGAKPPVYRLPLHLPGQQNITFPEGGDPEAVQNNTERKTTELMKFFDWYRDHPDTPDSGRYLYHRFPEHFVWHQREQEWRPRQRGFSIGRVYYANPVHGERYYLRLLLLHVPGPSSFDDLRMVNGRACGTFEEACRARGLL